jgi:methyl-accepting chemotaxis protein
MATRPYKRRHILIESYQYRLLFINLLYFCIILLIFAAALFLPLILKLRSGSASIIEQGELAGQFLALHARVWPAMLIVFVLLALHSILVSHRIAGPLYRFRKVFGVVARGDLSVRANLRKGDYLGKESESLNEMIASLRTKIESIQSHHIEMQTVLTALKQSIERGSIEDMHRQLEELHMQMEELRASIRQFRTHPKAKDEDANLTVQEPDAANL